MSEKCKALGVESVDRVVLNPLVTGPFLIGLLTDPIVIGPYHGNFVSQIQRGAPFTAPCAIAPLQKARAFLRHRHIASPRLWRGANLRLAAPCA